MNSSEEYRTQYLELKRGDYFLTRLCVSSLLEALFDLWPLKLWMFFSHFGTNQCKAPGDGRANVKLPVAQRVGKHPPARLAPAAMFTTFKATSIPIPPIQTLLWTSLSRCHVIVSLIIFLTSS